MICNGRTRQTGIWSTSVRISRSSRSAFFAMCLGIPRQIVAISDADNMLGIVDVSGVRREIHLACIVDEAHPIQSCVGDWVLVHVGFAMSRIDEAEAAQTLALFAELGELVDELRSP